MIRSLLLTLALVTAAVTFPGEGAGGAPAPAVQVVITNLDTGRSYPYAPKTWPTLLACKEALGNWPAVMAAVRDPDPNVTTPDTNAGDEDLDEALSGLVVQIFMNTGRLPNFSVGCIPAGSPA